MSKLLTFNIFRSEAIPKKLVLRLKRLTSRNFNRSSSNSKNRKTRSTDRRRNNQENLIDDEHLENFINLNAVKEPLKCKDCTAKFHTHLELGLHSVTHSADGCYSCHLCNYKKATKKTFQAHVKGHDHFQCEKCDRVFKFRLSAYKHSKSHPKEYVECEICGKRLKPECLKTITRTFIRTSS